jgi:hypothetical protein
MIESEWIERIWTCQEVSFAKAATAYYGPASCDWDMLKETITGSWRSHNRFASLFHIDDPYLQDLYDFRACTRRIAQLKVPKFESPDILLQFMMRGVRHSVATDPKDKVFGIWGILSRVVDIPPPDYTKSLSQIYGETMLAVSKANGWFELGHYFDPLDNPRQLPSWVSDYARIRDLRESQYSWSLLSSRSVLDISYTSRLNLRVITVDSIDRTGLSFPNPNKLPLSDPKIAEVITSWVDLCKEATKISSNGSVSNETKNMRALTEAMFAGYWRSSDKRAAEIEEILRSIGHWHGKTHPSSSRGFEVFASSRWEGRKLYRSQSKRFGMGGSSTAPGDIIVIAVDCRAPLILRPTEGCYTYIGPTHLSRAFWEEYWPALRNELMDITMDITLI